MEEGWRDGRQEAGPGGAWWGARRGAEAGPACAACLRVRPPPGARPAWESPAERETYGGPGLLARAGRGWTGPREGSP